MPMDEGTIERLSKVPVAKNETRKAEAHGDVNAGSEIKQLSAVDIQLHEIEEIRSNIKLRVATQKTLLGLLGFTNLATICLFIHAAYKQPLSNWALGELAGMSTAQVAVLLNVNARYLFPGPSDPRKRKTQAKSKNDA